LAGPHRYDTDADGTDAGTVDGGDGSDDDTGDMAILFKGEAQIRLRSRMVSPIENDIDTSWWWCDDEHEEWYGYDGIRRYIHDFLPVGSAVLYSRGNTYRGQT
jgi:hypothetical protein